ncbi:MAG: helix-turn-helix domain-containing protein, partial [Ignisphaera sp.]
MFRVSYRFTRVDIILLLEVLMLRPKEVCEKLGISYTTLREYVRRGWIKP